jgi:hypothetical protein
MSDKPQGPGWWLASDGSWNPPELHPSLQAEAAELVEVAERAAVGSPSPSPVPELQGKRTWSGETDRRPEAGPMYPDLFKQAVAGTSLADVVTLSHADDGSRHPRDADTGAHTPGGDLAMAGSSRTPAEVGAFTGASAKRRWRLHR